jgi:hypothetical protein
MEVDPFQIVRDYFQRKNEENNQKRITKPRKVVHVYELNCGPLGRLWEITTPDQESIKVVRELDRAVTYARKTGSVLLIHTLDWWETPDDPA